MDDSHTSSQLPLRDKSSTISLVTIGIGIILCLGVIVAVIGYVGLTSGTNSSQNNIVSIPTTTPLPSLEVSSPSQNEKVSGEFKVVGSTSGVVAGKLTVTLRDILGLKLSERVIELTSETWEAQLQVEDSPRSIFGFIEITSSLANVEKKRVDVEFEQQVSESGKLKISVPLKNQIVNPNELVVRGEAQGLFEGVLNIRIQDSTNQILLEEVVTIPDQLEDFNFFETRLNLDSVIVESSTDATIIFYYTSAMDGQEVVLLELPVRF